MKGKAVLDQAVSGGGFEVDGNRQMFGSVVWAERVPRKTGRRFSYAQAQLADLECLIHYRYGGSVPETDDSFGFVEVAAYALNAIVGQDALEPEVEYWCRVFAPWALENRKSLDLVINKLEGRKHQLSADQAAGLLAVRNAERRELGLRFIGAIDATKAERDAQKKARQKERDRERKERERRDCGSIPRSDFLAASNERKEPWKAAGVSRRTFYYQRCTGPSLLRNLPSGGRTSAKSKKDKANG